MSVAEQLLSLDSASDGELRKLYQAIDADIKKLQAERLEIAAEFLRRHGDSIPDKEP